MLRRRPGSGACGDAARPPPRRRYLFLEHVRADEPKLARAQDRIEPVWKVVSLGCHPNRETLGHIEAAFEVEEAERKSMPFGPKVVRPYVVGRARKPQP